MLEVHYYGPVVSYGRQEAYDGYREGQGGKGTEVDAEVEKREGEGGEGEIGSFVRAARDGKRIRTRRMLFR